MIPSPIVLLLLITWLDLLFSFPLKIFHAEKTDLQSVAFLIASEKYKIKWPSPVESLTSESFLLVQLEYDRLLENYLKAATSPRYLCVLKDSNSNALSDDDFNNVDKSDDDIIGYFDIDYSDECMIEYRNPIPYISDFAVNPQWRKQGIGSYMLYCADQICVNEWEVDRVHLWVDTDNIPAVRLYSKSGFVPIFGYKTATASTSDSDSEDQWGPLIEIEKYTQGEEKVVDKDNDSEQLEQIQSFSDHKSWAYDEQFLSSYRRILARKMIL
jgi:ribosomal protein S18 acetylase RimI-like enzyme